ncbi:hypothetical protein PF005_g20542 [Phytophthora fragariae]|uniref:GH16 domain-containing protein n=1 Tax=Phytophthora fragariae TaxID=53985 RepID=A0A6A3WL99_9STRA|nr:hypothetical protein PF005_g20542 [Phytophthora fragariae]
MDLCPASYDVNGDLSAIDNGMDHWAINTNGTCILKQNAYTDAYLCSAGNNDSSCTASSGSTSAMSEFSYQIDAISSNRDIQLAPYSDWVTYQLEWVMGDDGYIRWMLAGEPIFEITADALTNPPQDTGQLNPKKLVLEEPMYVIFNVALSSAWGTTPSDAGNRD